MTHLAPLAAWIYAAMVVLSPLDRANLPTVPEARETPEERGARYEEIAATLAMVVESERPLFSGRDGTRSTAATALAVLFFESGFRRDVDLGLGKQARGGGLDACGMQLRLGRGQLTAEGWSAEEIMADREKCYRAGIHFIRRSYVACAALAPEHRLAVYASGTCAEGPGWRESKKRIDLARRILGRGGPLTTPKAPTAPGAAKAPSAVVLAPLGPLSR